MSFEFSSRDILGRLGKIKTMSGVIETPILLPVISPTVQSLSLKTMKEEFNCQAIITNAYILKKRYGETAIERGIHELLDFDGVVMTDSGAYQILVYGKVDVTPQEIIKYQECISTDIATILDIPTKWNVTKDEAECSVNETIKRAEGLVKTKTKKGILWVAPIQGGRYLDLVKHSAESVGKLPFEIHALGSPTSIMKQYRFDILFDMILTAKMNIPLNRPLHLFGAGHPFMFAFAVALGCDLFDSAAYALFAKQNLYMTEFGTSNLDRLEYFPCSCPVCIKITPKGIRDLPKKEREKLLALHNLYVSFAEVKRIKQNIIEGRLWEYLEIRAHAHPSLLQAMKQLKKYEDFFESQSPASKKKGLFFFSNLGLMRPEIVRYRSRLKNRYKPPEEAKILILLPQPSKKPFHTAREVKALLQGINKEFKEKNNVVQICIYAAPFGVVPLELDDVYPLSQHEIACPPDSETIGYVIKQVEDYITSQNYEEIIVIENPKILGAKSASVYDRIDRKDLSIRVMVVKEPLNKVMIKTIIKEIKKSLFWREKRIKS